MADEAEAVETTETNAETVTAEVVDPGTGAQTTDKTTGDDTSGKTVEATDFDWRSAAAGEDKDLQKLVKRFGSITSMARALADSRAQISKGQNAPNSLPEDASDEEKSAWRKSRDIPDAPDKYDTAIKGVEWTEDDRQVIGDFARVMHDQNVPQGAVKQALQWYADNQIAAQQERDVAAVRMQKDTEKALKAEYGADYDRNVSLMKECGASQLGQEAWDGFVGLRMEDGTRLGDNPAFMKLIVESAIERGDGLPFLTGGAAGGKSDADLIKDHGELTRKEAAGDREARAKLKDPAYEAMIQAAYERKARREERSKAA